MKTINRLPLHPFLFAVYLVLALFSVNAVEVEAGAAVRPIVFAVLLAGVALLVSWGLTGSATKGAVLASLFLLLVFSYGHMYALARQAPLLNAAIGRHRAYLSRVDRPFHIEEVP